MAELWAVVAWAVVAWAVVAWAVVFPIRFPEYILETPLRHP